VFAVVGTNVLKSFSMVSWVNLLDKNLKPFDTGAPALSMNVRFSGTLTMQGTRIELCQFRRRKSPRSRHVLFLEGFGLSNIIQKGQSCLEMEERPLEEAWEKERELGKGAAI
jgi:hypothetical protein